MDITKLSQAAIENIALHEAEVEKLEVNKDTIYFRLKFGDWVYERNRDILNDIFIDPVKNYLVVDLLFEGVKIDAFVLSNDFILNEDISITNNTYDKKTKIFNIGFEDSAMHYMDFYFRYKSYKWIYVGEVKKEI